MKTAISIPDEVFAAAEELSRRLGMSRSELYATAVAEYVEKIRSSGVTARLNQVYAGESSTLDAGLAAAQADAVVAEEW